MGYFDYIFLNLEHKSPHQSFLIRKFTLFYALFSLFGGGSFRVGV